MKTTLKTVLVVMVLVLSLAIMTACVIEPQPTTPTTPTTPACEHTGGTATCQDAAVCEKCGESYGEKLEHTVVVIDAVEPTCTESGMTEGRYCSVCNEVFASQEVVDALGHEDGDDNDHLCDRKGCFETASECKAAENSHVCEVCGDELTKCAAGENSHNCAVCGAELSKCAAGANSHNCATCGVELTKCEAAENSHSCGICGKVHSEHAYDNTCDTTCNVCGEAREITHTEETVKGKDATCTETGLTDGKKCKVCGVTTVEQTVIAANGHKDGNSDFTCDVCAADLCTSHVEVVLEAVPATCTATGLTAGKKCSRCGDIIEAQVEVPVLGHSYVIEYVWSSDYTTCTAKKVCTNDAFHVEASETAAVKKVTLNVTATKVTYTYAVEFASSEFTAQTATSDSAVELVDSIATINAPAVADRVASHDYVKFGFHDASAAYEFVIYYSEVDVWNGTSVSEALSGSGTLEDPYLIETAADFAYLASVINAVEGEAGVNYKVTTFKGEYFKLTKSIDLNGYSLTVGFHAGWNNYQGFFGTLDGNNCTIRGINIDNSTGSTSSALFGCINTGAIKNLSVYGNVKGNVNTASLVAYATGGAALENITSYVNVISVIATKQGTVGGIVANQENSAGALLNCVNYGDVTCDSYIVGGIVGSGGATMTNCVNWGNVTGGDESIGGISGTTKNKGTISGCVNYGDVCTTGTSKGKVGGIAGNCVKPVSSSVNYGEIKGALNVGGICGITTSTIDTSVNNGNVIGTSCTSTGIDGICASDVTKTDCVNNGTVETIAHQSTHHEAVAAGCETDGNVEYWACSVCNKNYDAEGNVISDVVISATGHSWDSGVIADGKITFTCQNDASHTRVEDAKYTVTVNHLNLDGTVAAEAEALEFIYNEIATINAKTIEGYVASHDYVKLHVLSDASVTIYYSEVDVWDGTDDWDGTTNVATTLDALGGTGVADDPYIIDSASDLAIIANIVNSLAGKGSSDLINGKYFKLTKSIDLNNKTLYIGGYTGWSTRRIFNGYLDGNNCSIRGINNDRALFGCVEGSVSNLSLYGTIYSENKVGNEAALVGYLRGTVHHITNYANVSGHTQVGGIVGNLECKTASTYLTNYGTISSITSKDGWSAVGGVIGCMGYGHSYLVNWGTVTSVGSQAGGITGYGHASRAGNITEAYNYGTVYCESTTKGQIAGALNSHTLVDCAEYGELVDTLPSAEE